MGSSLGQLMVDKCLDLGLVLGHGKQGQAGADYENLKMYFFTSRSISHYESSESDCKQKTYPWREHGCLRVSRQQLCGTDIICYIPGGRVHSAGVRAAWDNQEEIWSTVNTHLTFQHFLAQTERLSKGCRLNHFPFSALKAQKIE